MLVTVNEEGISIRLILKTLDLYAKWSGQMVNKEQLTLFISNKISSSRKKGLLCLLGFV